MVWLILIGFRKQIYYVYKLSAKNDNKVREQKWSQLISRV